MAKQLVLAFPGLLRIFHRPVNISLRSGIRGAAIRKQAV